METWLSATYVLHLCSNAFSEAVTQKIVRENSSSLKFDEPYLKMIYIYGAQVFEIM